MNLLKNHFSSLAMMNFWTPARLLFAFPETPRPESEAFKEFALDYEGFDGKATIGDKGKYIPENTPTINHAVLDMVIQSEVAIKKTDPARAKEIKKQRAQYVAVITNSILRVTSSLVRKGDTLTMKGSEVTVTHKEKDGEARTYTLDVNETSGRIVERAVRETTLKRSRQSMEMLSAEIAKKETALATPLDAKIKL
ncbi:hypothetical protein HZA41_03430 [Candidatus Peregrinibacteria bacterium]|nr:hypothetical protein [Candidatus Peregrinibacteria bacterium]